MNKANLASSVDVGNEPSTCMKFNYQLTHGELVKSLSLLGIPTVGAWLAYLVVASAMFPSIILFAAIGAETCLTWFGVMLISILIAAAWAYWKRTGYPHPFQESMEFSSARLLYRFGSSRFECRWNMIDKVEDHQEHLRIYTHGRPMMLPKRVLGDSADACLQFLLSMTNKEVNPSTEHEEASIRLPPIDLYREMIPTDISNGYKYQVSNLDLEQAVQEKFSVVTPDYAAPLPAIQRNKPIWLQAVNFFLLWLAFGVLTFFVSRLSDQRITMEKVVLISCGWFFPIVWLLVWRRFSWLFRTPKIKQKVPDQVSTLTLTPTGWVIANPTSGTFGHWKDVQFILQSENFIGMRMINQLAYLIPKRIFASPRDVDDFLEQSLEFQRTQFEAKRSFQRTEQSPAIESRNPYQSPQR